MNEDNAAAKKPDEDDLKYSNSEIGSNFELTVIKEEKKEQSESSSSCEKGLYEI